MSDARRIRDAVVVAKAAIEEDITAGVVPASVRSFSELHDFVDANDYMTECLPSAAFGSYEAWTDALNEAEEQVDVWLRGGRK